ncbi:peptide synthetase [Amycolatopsis sp. SID8362]|uniref:peptide synthetase n=1 Tax=Amycolatopsis sp. SID8362 TaxID=2690346 RepID=UPI00136EAF8C|nr:peptide synthetase [Amycolatopsis sp. SID8362]NBH06079.1 peptide synthetase [Amycolatopsis sp. SID8362]NED42778.1 peptide synthetase [Amycolatopsis sp. SID8362]
MNRFTRPISPTEWFYLAAGSLVIQLVVRGEGTIDGAALRRAVAAAGDACPGSRLVRRDRRWVDSGLAPPVREIRSIDEDRFESAALRRPLSADGPTCEVLALPDGVVFRTNHAAMDGRGALRWAHEVFRALRAEPPVPALSEATDFELVDRFGGGTSDRPLRSRSPFSGRGRGFLVRRRTIAGIHPGLVAKLAAATTGFSGHGHASYLVPVDLRRHDATIDSTANLALPIFLDARPGQDWRELDKQLLGALFRRLDLTSGTERLATRLPIGLLGRTLRVLGPVSARLDRNLATAIISHLGKIDLAALSTEGFTASTAYALPVDAPFTPLSLVVTECDGRTEMTLGCAGGAGLASQAEALLDQIEELLSPSAIRG